ncbi:MAG: heparinase II/III family protein, partial [Planctomycetaceae bacterium]
LPPDPQANPAAAISAGRFTFAGDERAAGWPPDWTGGDAPLLWRYNLHYLDWLWALPPAERLDAALDWAERHPPAPSAVGWAPYPTSLRLENLCLLAAESGAAAAALWPTIWRQAEHLSRRLEYHLLGNHLLENGIALAFVGCCFAGPDADRWLETGLGILREQLPEQVLPDGMHFERSPMYQVRLVHALAMLANAGHEQVRPLVSEPLGRMAAALATVCHPDGQIAILNDAAFGVYPEPGAVLAFTAAVLGDRPLPPVPRHLPNAGYFTGRGPGGDAVICDAGPLGPDYLPGHAHGDIFSFELSLGGFSLSGWHDGFRHLPGAPIHQRRFRWHDAGVLAVHDEVTASAPVTAAARLHLHPECHVVEAGDRHVKAVCGDVPFTVAVGSGPAPRITEGWYCPRFGVRQRSHVIVLEDHGRSVGFTFAVARGHDTAFTPDGRSLVAGGRTFVA